MCFLIYCFWSNDSNHMLNELTSFFFHHFKLFFYLIIIFLKKNMIVLAVYHLFYLNFFYLT